jgi:CMP-N,N'-diacetyllegionaminic acid synthase
MNIVATICARGGSKGVPRKNIRPLCGKPLIVHTIEIAQKCRLINRIIVSTDDREIAETARKAGAEVPFMRPKELAQDDTAKLPVIKHAIQFLESQGYSPDIVVDLDPTSPLRTEKDIEACIRMVMAGEADNVFSVTRASKSPYFNMVEIIDGKVRLVKQLDRPAKRRQDAPEVYDMNASIYVWKRDALMNNETIYLENTRIYLMPKWAIDIDDETDFEFVEYMLSRRIK